MTNIKINKIVAFALIGLVYVFNIAPIVFIRATHQPEALKTTECLAYIGFCCLILKRVDKFI